MVDGRWSRGEGRNVPRVGETDADRGVLGGKKAENKTITRDPENKYLQLCERLREPNMRGSESPREISAGQRAKTWLVKSLL